MILAADGPPKVHGIHDYQEAPEGTVEDQWNISARGALCWAFMDFLQKGQLLV